MRMDGTRRQAVPPISGSARARGERMQPQIDDAVELSDRAPARMGRALVPVDAAPETAARPPVPSGAPDSALNAQLIAQRMPTRSERRLNRYFPDRAIAAYRHHAGLLAEARRERHRRSA
jgi:hypothetical protein